MITHILVRRAVSRSPLVIQDFPVARLICAYLYNRCIVVKYLDAGGSMQRLCKGVPGNLFLSNLESCRRRCQDQTILPILDCSSAMVRGLREMVEHNINRCVGHQGMNTSSSFYSRDSPGLTILLPCLCKQLLINYSLRPHYKDRKSVV